MLVDALERHMEIDDDKRTAVLRQEAKRNRDQ